MANPQYLPVFWPGSGSSPSGLVPQGVFEDDDIFADTAPQFATWAALRLGYPIMQVELTDAMLYTCFEEAIIEYSAQVNEFNMRENMWSLQGISTGSSVSQTFITSNPLPAIIELSAAYGTEAGSGGTVDYKRFGIPMTASKQEYDLKQYIGRDVENGNRIKIRRVYHETPPAIARIFDPFAAGGAGGSNLMGSFGWGGYAVESSFLMAPMYETLLRTQAIEFNDQIRRSQYSFELRNNRLKLFPIPDGVVAKVWVDYTVTADSFASASNGSGHAVVSDYSNAPYTNIWYGNINDVGRRWIWRFGLALAKETLGAVRIKYREIPIPNSVITMDGELLKQEASQEKDILWKQLRETLEKTGRKAQLEAAKDNAENANAVMAGVPLLLFIG